MRAMFSIAALLIVLAVIGVLVKQQLSAASLPAVSAEAGEAAASEPMTQRQQTQQQLQQFKSDLNQTLRQGAARNEPAE
nr:hypothetical protein [uncultured Caldimonas sp.]